MFDLQGYIHNPEAVHKHEIGFKKYHNHNTWKAIKEGLAGGIGDGLGAAIPGQS